MNPDRPTTASLPCMNERFGSWLWRCPQGWRLRERPEERSGAVICLRFVTWVCSPLVRQVVFRRSSLKR